MIPHEVVSLVLEHEITSICAWRQYLKLTQAEVARRMGMAQTAYAEMEKIEGLSHDVLEKIATALGITFEQLDF